MSYLCCQQILLDQTSKCINSQHPYCPSAGLCFTLSHLDYYRTFLTAFPASLSADLIHVNGSRKEKGHCLGQYFPQKEFQIPSSPWTEFLLIPHRVPCPRVWEGSHSPSPSLVNQNRRASQYGPCKCLTLSWTAFWWTAALCILNILSILK